MKTEEISQLIKKLNIQIDEQNKKLKEEKFYRENLKEIDLKMEYKTIVKELGKLGDTSQQISKELKENTDLALTQFMGDRLKEELKNIDDLAKSQLEELHKEAQQFLDDGLNRIQKDLDKIYFNDLEVNRLAELEMIDKSNLDIEEMNGYLRKFSLNKAALRRFEKIVSDKGYLLSGLSYTKEIDFMKGFKNLGQSLVNAIHSGDTTYLSISTNLLIGKVEEYDELYKMPLQIFDKN